MEPEFSIGDTVEIIDAGGGGEIGEQFVVQGITSATMSRFGWFYTLDNRTGFGLFQRRLKLALTEIPYDPTQQGETEDDI